MKLLDCLLSLHLSLHHQVCRCQKFLCRKSHQEKEQMEEMSEAVPHIEAQGTMPIANFAKLSVSAGTPERQEVSTPPVLPPVQEQAGPQDVEMVETGPNTVVSEEDEAELTFGEPSRKLTPAEEAAY